jgi:paxillin
VREPSEPPVLDVDLEALDELDENNPVHIPYLERGQRWLERQEAHSLRMALEDMDLQREQELHVAAQAEASELVWRHQNPNAPIPNPDAPYDYREHLRKESGHQRAASWARAAQELQSRNAKIRSRNSSASRYSRSISGGSKSSSAPSSRVPSDSSLKVPDSPDAPVGDIQLRKISEGERQPRKRSVQFVEPELVVASKPIEPETQKERGRTPSLQRLHQAAAEKKAVGPDEDVKVSSIAVAARLASNTMPGSFRNPFSRVRNAKASLSRASTAPMPETKRLDTVEIQRNPPTKSHDPQYTLNASLPPSPDLTVQASVEEGIRMKDGKEVRSDDIRKATSMSLRDRSPKLPTPTMVSDKPGRPIVSFDKNYRPKEVELKMEHSTTRVTPLSNLQSNFRANTNKPLPALEPTNRTIPSISVTGNSRATTDRTAPRVPVARIPDSPPIPSIQIGNQPPVPTISVNEVLPIAINAPSIPVQPPSITVEPPSISISAPPSISVNEAATFAPPTRPLPTPSKTSARPPPRHAATAPASQTRGHWTPVAARGSALCAQCALPISGRIVSAAGARFHPECFRCHYCGEGLECVAFYPEPENSRAERLARIEARMHGEYLEEQPGCSEHEDGDAALRFYCHLDFHEFFSPRCKSCKTPIEGEVVVACGAEWHVGHFFCAQCGDVRTTSSPFPPVLVPTLSRTLYYANRM